jgi:isoquinoline 1-oxidoreductase alpha subunit
MISFELNGQSVSTDASPDTPLLWVIRDYFKLKGSKFGCGMGLCGACTMHLNGEAIRTCIYPIAAAEGSNITTIEGISPKDTIHLVQQAWVDRSVPQCGYCQSGQIMAASALLTNNNAPTDSEIDRAMQGNICRCGTYPRIKQAIKDAASAIQANGGVAYYTPSASTPASTNSPEALT